MKLMAMHKVTADMEAGVKPGPEIIQGMGALVGEMVRKGALLAGDGLHRTALRARVSAKGVEKGPYSGRNELVAGFCLLRSASLEEAIGWGGRIAAAMGPDAEVEIGPVVEAWDLGFPAPATKPPLRFLALAKADAAAESGKPFMPRVAAPLEEMKKAGVFISADGLAASKQAKRVRIRKGRQEVLDGPFTESKEMIAGFCLMELPTWEEALSFCERFANVLGGEVEMDLRPVG